MFTLVTGLAGHAWVEAATALAQPYLRAVTIGAGDCLDVYCDWQRVREIDEDGALLVRPDGYIAWRAMAGLGDYRRCSDMLLDVLRSVLAVSPAMPLSGPSQSRAIEPLPN